MATCTSPCVQSPAGSFSFSATSLPLAFGSNVTSGNLLIAATIGAATTSIADTRGNVWAKYSPASDFNFWYARAKDSGADTVTISTSAAAGYMLIDIAEFSGFTVNYRVDKTSVSTGAGGASYNSGSATTLADGELIIGFANTDMGTSVAGAGYTSLQTVDGSNLEYQVQSAKGSISATWTNAGSPTSNTCYMVTFWNPVPNQFPRSN